MAGFLLRALISALGLWIAAHLVPGFHFDNPKTLILAALLLGIVNAIVRPIAIILTLPITILTLGLFLLVINTLMIWLVSWVLRGFHIASFGDAFLGALIVWLTSWVANHLIGSRGFDPYRARVRRL